MERHVKTGTDRNEDRCVEMPSLVFSILVKSSEDVDFLKICRLVCKEWNYQASAALQAYSLVRLEEDDVDRVRKFNNLLLNGRISALPSPFQNFNVEASSLSDDTFNGLINLPFFTISKFSIFTSDARVLDPMKFEALFESKGATMTDVLFTDTHEDHNAMWELSLRNKYLMVEDDCDPRCVHKENFMKFFRKEGIIEEITIDICDSELLIAMLTPDRIKNVTKLDLKILGREIWEIVGAYVMPRLKNLRIFYEDYHCLEFLTNAASTLEELEIEFANLNLFPVLPKLKQIRFRDWRDEFGLFSPATFPILEHVELSVSEPIETFLPKTGFHPHDKVKTVVISLTSYIDNPIIPHFHVLMDYLKCQFPNATSLQLLKIPVIETSTFLAIHNAFPGLQEIWLDGETSFTLMSGSDKKMVTDYLEYGLDIQHIPRKCSILSFLKLEKLVLTSDWRNCVTNDMVTYCLSKIPSLKTISFHWNEALTVQEVRDCLGHLQKIIILNGAAFQEIMEELRKSLPGIIVEDGQDDT
ncbi:unnamed protein product [Allacma fusca]|uniref:Uncharacterized protein n=1 Tax=Allacma fusca TaxID=39272 RepID=A0A8J2LVX6_9HEXA|nr:unnamed protein product [Allacma fusca]